MMYYRVAIQKGQPPTWRWKSTVLSSLDTLFHFLRLYRALPPDQLRVFSSCSRESLDEQIMRENSGLESTSVTASQFLQDRLIRLDNMPAETSTPRVHSEVESMDFAVIPSSRESSLAGPILDGRNTSALENRRVEIERGIGGDHDLPYTFALSASWPQVLAWTKLLVRVRAGALQP
jgi:hypothetical protein